MAVTSVEPTRESHNDQYPLLMERHDGHVNGEHVIDIQRGGGEPSSSGSSDFEFSDGSVRHYHDGRVVNSTQQLPLGGSTPSSPSQMNSRSPSFGRRMEGWRNWSPFNSGFWITIEFIFTLSLIIASVTVLWVSRDEHPRAPLFSWVVGYTAGCFASLPILYWRFLHRNQSSDRSGGASQSNSTSPRANSSPGQSSYVTASLSPSPEQEVDHSSLGPAFEGQAHTRCGRVMDHFKMALDCFFVVWFIVGTVWIFGGHATAAEAPNLYRLCIVYLTFSCIGYAMPFILCAMVCCCLPCIISVLGIREELNQVRGASDESISALPTYRFKAQKDGSCTGDPNDEEGGAGGVVAAGTEKERVISGEDAVCCICLTKYMDDEELRELPCTHFFHAECVDRWLKINATCPLCKFEICEREENATPGSAPTPTPGPTPTPTPGPTPTPSQVQPASET